MTRHGAGPWAEADLFWRLDTNCVCASLVSSARLAARPPSFLTTLDRVEA